MYLVNGIVIPKYLKEKVFVASDCELSSFEVELFNKALQNVSEQLMIESFDIDEISGVNICFSKIGNISYSADKSKHELGVRINTIVYIMNNIRYKSDGNLLFATYIEEMAHHFWKIDDEIKLKHKVVEIAQRYDKNITLEFLRKRGVPDT